MGLFSKDERKSKYDSREIEHERKKRKEEDAARKREGKEQQKQKKEQKRKLKAAEQLRTQQQAVQAQRQSQFQPQPQQHFQPQQQLQYQQQHHQQQQQLQYQQEQQQPRQQLQPSSYMIPGSSSDPNQHFPNQPPQRWNSSDSNPPLPPPPDHRIPRRPIFRTGPTSPQSTSTSSDNNDEARDDPNDTIENNQTEPTQDSDHDTEKERLFRHQKIALGRISSRICLANHRLASTAAEEELRKTTRPEDVEGQVQTIIKRYNASIAELESAYDHVEEEMNKSKMATNRLENHVQELETRHTADMARLQKDNELRRNDHVENMLKVAEKHAAAEITLNNDILGLQKANRAAQARHVAEQQSWQRKLEDELNAAAEDLNRQHAQRVADMQGEIDARRGEKHEIQKRHEKAQQDLRNGYDAHRVKELKEQSQKYQDKINQLEGDKALLEADRRTTYHKHQDQLAEAIRKTKASSADEIYRHKSEITRHKEDIIRLGNEKKALVARQNVDLGDLEKRWNNHFNEQMKTLTSNHEKELAALISKHDREMGVLISKHERETDRLKDENAQLQKNFASEKAGMLRDFEKRREQAERGHENAIVHLKVDNEALKGALVARDQFKAMADHDVSSRFQDVASEIDGLARVVWDTGLAGQWPWKDHELRKSGNVRRLKQHIIQDRIWLVLWQHIFCSPFRVFEEEGISLERRWARAMGQDQRDDRWFEWPTPTQAAEQWRYAEVRKCLDGIDKSGSELKDIFDHSIANVVKDLSAAIAVVSAVDSSTLQELKVLARKTAKLWLEIGTQRCRILVVIPKQSEDALQNGYARRNREGTLQLVVQPEVKRKGNSQGAELDLEETVAGCEGIYSSFSPE